MTSEAELLYAIRLEPFEGVRLFRNNVGTAMDSKGNFLRYGLCTGISDLIGWRTLVITPKDVGNELAVFCAIEAKSERGIMTATQGNFLKAVTAAGGFAGVVRTVEEARR